MPSKLEQMQQQFRRQLLQEKEERLIKIHTESQQKALSKVARYNGISSVSAVNAQPPVPPAPHHSPVKKGSPGVDRSRPLPPISKERSYTSTRTSPVSAPTDNNTLSKAASINTRSKSVDLPDSRPGLTGGRGQQQYENESPGTMKNVYPKFSETSQPRSSAQPMEYDRKPDHEIVTKTKQAESQRVKAKQTRDDTHRVNGISSDISSKSSTTTTSFSQRKTPVATKPPATTPARTRPSFQGATAASSRRTTAPASKSTTRRKEPQPPQAESRNPPGPGQEQCRVCGRNFNTDRIEKHVTICSKAAQKKVKVFDATKMRVKGTEAEQFVRKGLPKTEQLKPKQSDWRKKHNDFIEAIRQAKIVQQHLAKGGKVSDLPPPPPSDTSDYVPCPYCGRKFNGGVAERHIPKCKNILSNKKNHVPKKK